MSEPVPLFEMRVVIGARQEEDDSVRHGVVIGLSPLYLGAAPSVRKSMVEGCIKAMHQFQERCEAAEYTMPDDSNPAPN